MDRERLLQRFEEEFNKTRDRLGFAATLEELDAVFYFRDRILERGYVSTALSRFLAHRIAETFNSWITVLHGWMMPNPGSILVMREAEQFTDQDRDQMMRILAAFTELLSRNAIIGLTKDAAAEQKYFDDALRIWRTHQPTLVAFYKRINAYWAEESAKGEGKVHQV